MLINYIITRATMIPYIAAAILLTMAAGYVAAQQRWKLEDKMSYLPDGNAYGNLLQLGTFDTRDLCQEACGNNEACNAYTWSALDNPKDPRLCVGMNNITKRSESPYMFSGEKLERSRFGKAAHNFSRTLRRRLGMDSAGSNSTGAPTPAPETFSTNSRVGTFYNRY